MNVNAPAWVMADGPESDIVVSTRARLARNLASIPFPNAATEDQLARVAALVGSAARRSEHLGHNAQIVRIEDLTEADKINLVDAHVVSPEHLGIGPERQLILEPKGQAAIMVNEEDHLRVQAVLSGLAPEDAWELVDLIDDELGRSLEFAYSRRYGYLTASITNVGTGLRVSQLMHLGGLAMIGKLKTTLSAAYELGVSVRGLFGEGTSGLGDYFQVSNEVTLGLEERDIVRRVKGTAKYLLTEERRAREILIDEHKTRLTERIRESLRTLTKAINIKGGEALRLLSPVRAACSTGLVSGIGFRELNEILAAVRLVHNADAKASRFDLAKSDVDRASLLREKLKNVRVTEDLP